MSRVELGNTCVFITKLIANQKRRVVRAADPTWLRGVPVYATRNERKLTSVNKNGRSMFRGGLLVCTLFLAYGIASADDDISGARPLEDTVKEAGGGRAAFVTTDDLTVGGVTPVTMASRIAGGLVVGGTETFNGLPAGPWFVAARAGGHFAEVAGPGPIGIPSGTILSTGDIWTAEDGAPFWNMSDSTTFRNGTPGDPPHVGVIAGRPTFDAAILEFDITSAIPRTIRFRYVFGSEEHDGFAPSRFNDGFGIWITDPAGPVTTNVAQLPMLGFSDVTINNMRRFGVGVNMLFHADNDCNVVGVPPGFPCDGTRQTELDGLTQRFGTFADKIPFYNPPITGPPSILLAIPITSLPYAMAPGVVYHVKIAIADASDRSYDSVVMLGSAYPGACFHCNARADFVCQNGVEETDCTETWAEGYCIDMAPGCPGVPTGACTSLLDGTCTITTINVCEDANGVYAGDSTTCGDLTGGCCLDNGACVEAFAAACTEMAGAYQDDDTTCGPLGACQKLDGSCIETTEDCCTFGTGSYQGDASTCVANGACCSGGSCSMTTAGLCQGTYHGDGTICSESICQGHAIPTVSEWGLMVLVLLVLTAGTMVFSRLRRPMAA